MLKRDRPMNKLDFAFLFAQCFNVGSYLTYVVCIFWDLDGPYWILEDFASDAKQRTIPTIVSFLLVRTFLLFPGLLELNRSAVYSGIGYLSLITYLEKIIQTLVCKVRNQEDFFRYYNQLCIFSNILGPFLERATILVCTVFYFLNILLLWVCISGFGDLDLVIYSLFVICALGIAMMTAVFLPIVACTGEVINGACAEKLKQSRNIYCTFKTIENKVYLKKTVALRSIRFSYGSNYPLGNNFSRNYLDNMAQDLLSMVLLKVDTTQ